MIKKQAVSFLVLFAAAVFAADMPARAEEAPLPRVEGIIFDAAEPSESVAAIDGELYKAGSSLGEYEVTGVHENHVEVIHAASGKTLELRAEKLPELDAGPAPGELPVVDSSEAQGGTMFARLLQKVFHLNMPLAETAALSEMKRLYAAAMTYVINEGYTARSLDLPTLVRKGELSRDYEDSIKGAYRFSLKVLNEGVDVQADPVKKESGLRHFLLAADGTLYYERGKPATRQSAFRNN